MKKVKYHIYATFLFTIIFSSLFISYPQDAFADAVTDDNIVTFEVSKSYDSYLAEHKEVDFSDKTIVINASDYSSSSYTPEIKQDYEGMGGDCMATTDSGYVEWSVSIDEPGFYNIGVDYYPIAGKSSTIIRAINIDGKLPYDNTRSVQFARVWADVIGKNGKVIQEDFKKNDMCPSQEEKPRWMSVSVRDSQGYISNPLKFYFSKGAHKIRFIAVNEPMLIRKIILFQDKTPLDYKTVKQQYTEKGYKSADCEPVKFQAEISKYKSDPMIVPVFDRSSPATEPNDPAKLRLNCIGAEKWQLSGQWISWEFSVSETGLYKIGMKERQNIVNGAYSSRRIYIDGKVPFKELDAVKFMYNTDWQMFTLGGKNEPYEFFLEAGKHQIMMEVTLGDMADILEQVMDTINQLNAIYRRILMITGPSHDIYRDYQFDVIMPDVLDNLKKQSDSLLKEYNAIVSQTGMNGQNAQLINTLYDQTSEMFKKPENIAKRFTAFKKNIIALGTWVMTTTQQPLTIDYFVVAPLKADMPNPNAGFFQNILYSILSFISSFFEDYNNVSDTNDTEAVKVWVGNGLTGGRDQALILKTMADNYFTSQTGINVNIQLVSMGALLPATLSGKGPDVALTLGSGDPVNYAVRHAVINLAQFSDYAEVAKRFSPSAMVPLSFGNGVYGLPETQTYPMLFYRKDILAELKLKLPQTWEDVIEMLPVLQKKQLNFGLPSTLTANGIFPIAGSDALFLIQKKGQFYDEENKKSALDSKQSIEAFSFLTSLYTDYQIHNEYDFVNRFRSGEIPIGVADYSTYNMLSVFAPEINGAWDFASVPGTIQPDGTIDRSVPGSVNACVILNQANDKNNAWEFIKWWTSTNTQVKFGRELESIMGTAARYPTANMEALYQIPWSKTNFDSLMLQWKWVKGIPEVPGGYYTPRYVDFAFRDVFSNHMNPGERIRKAAKSINTEIYKKRKEFNLPN